MSRMPGAQPRASALHEGEVTQAVLESDPGRLYAASGLALSLVHKAEPEFRRG
jgi:hypothetical protein